MKPRIPLIGMSLLILVGLSASTLAGGRSLHLTVVYSNSINGEVQPCPT